MNAALILAGTHRKPHRPGQQRRIAGQTVMIQTVTALTLADITHDQARALGHKGTAAFKRAWVAHHDWPWLCREDRSDADILARYAERWAHRDAVFIRCAHVGTPRFMAPVPRGDERGYTTSAGASIDPTAECVDDATQARYAKDALGFCIGRQLSRAQEEKARRDERARSKRAA
jgi:hypothetical protein